ncbi:MAG: hypothetical protein ACTHMS_23660 [Jatrophihabitans sp.]|uniref:hypothetical protein n=1 Tax=Jatrophihabitans sp. TaxID=1932789 RepID=UPI003F7E0BEF
MADETVTRPGTGMQVVRLGDGTPIDVVAAEHAAGMDNTNPFAPGTPIPALQGYEGRPRHQDFITGYNIAARPRSQERVAFSTLRELIKAYDVAQMCIWHRIDSVRSLKWDLVAMDGYEGRDIDQARAWGIKALNVVTREVVDGVPA